MKLPAIPYSRIADPGAIEAVRGEETLTTLVPTLLDGQHEIRKWEYTMAYEAIVAWDSYTKGPVSRPLEICDVGGAGSQFWRLLKTLTYTEITIVDPSLAGQPGEGAVGFRDTLESFAAVSVHGTYDIVTVISVIEHLDAVRPLLRAAHMLLRPGGLLFLTTDCWNSEGPDQAHFHWMRKRIYNPEEMRRLKDSTKDLGFTLFGKTDWTYRGDTVYDYSVASLAMLKRAL